MVGARGHLLFIEHIKRPNWNVLEWGQDHLHFRCQVMQGI